MNVYGKVRVMVTDCPRHVVIFDNGKRTRLYPVVTREGQTAGGLVTS